MKKINEQDLNLEKSVKVGSGTTASCYLLNDQKTIYKKFYSPKKEIDQYEKLANQYNKDIAYPTDLIVTPEDELIGYLMPYFYGYDVTYLSINDLQTFINICKKCEKLILTEYKKGIFITDFHRKNLIVANNTIKIIDTDQFIFTKYVPENVIFNDYNYMMYRYFLRSNYVLLSKIKTEINLNGLETIPFSKILTVIWSYLEEKYQININNIDEINKYLTRSVSLWKKN